MVRPILDSERSDEFIDFRYNECLLYVCPACHVGEIEYIFNFNIF